MFEIAIDELLDSPLVDPRRHLDPDRVHRFSTLIDQLPPVVVFRLEDRALLLADGYHRVAAAQEVGRSTVRADIRDGTMADAMQFAVELAVRERGSSAEHARAAIQHYSDGRWGAT
jgi:ParB-like chromosome segregation protein Spo0J